MNAIAAVPSLIAQLKICYEAIDHMKEALLEQTNTNVFLVQTLEKRDDELAGYKEVAECAGMYQRCCDQLGNEDDLHMSDRGLENDLAPAAPNVGVVNGSLGMTAKETLTTL